MKVIPYGRQSIGRDDIRAVTRALASDFLTQGPKIKEFEASLCRYAGANYAVVVSSGTAALHLACLAAGLGAGDEAITSPNTFLATANAALYVGAKPVFADVNTNGNIDLAQIEKKINAKTRAILPVHFAGVPCDMPKIRTLAKKKKLIVIEDSCHALGAQYKSDGRWIKVGSCLHSDMAAFSFHPVKHITTGEGGAILTNRKDLWEKLTRLREHGMTRDRSRFKNPDHGGWYYEMQELGYNYRLTDIQCALGISQMKKLSSFIKRRREIVASYHKAFSDNNYFDLPLEPEHARSAWHLYPVRLKDRFLGKKKELFGALRKSGVYVQVHYIPVYLQPYYRKLGFRPGSCPAAEDHYRRTLSLPIYPKMTEKDQRLVISRVNQVFMDMNND